ncbi:MAG: hypothetical protein AB8B61_07045, partial [Cyclobacteriaceae bacterium]
YFQLEKIAGSSLVKVYNIINGVLFCFLAGAMITVSASAVGIPFGINLQMPDFIFGLGGTSFTIIVLVVGAVMALVAAAGYETVSKFANIAAPWMIIVFVACGITALVQMDATSWATIKEAKFWTEGVNFVQSKSGAVEFGFWKIVVFSWLCNGAMHFGMADLSIFRFAKSENAGWASSIGMFLGHYVAWICAALLLAAQIKLSQDATANPGALAWSSIGWTGIVCVVIAGWTTANPTIYRAGLAFQSFFPNSKAYTGTLIAGGIATLAGLFPNLSGKLLDFVGTYGTVLGPVGGIIFVNHYFSDKFNFKEDLAEKLNINFNIAVLIAWLAPVTVGLYLIFAKGVFAAYSVIPCWIASAVIYVLLASIKSKKIA